MVVVVVGGGGGGGGYCKLPSTMSDPARTCSYHIGTLRYGKDWMTFDVVRVWSGKVGWEWVRYDCGWSSWVLVHSVQFEDVYS